MATCTNPPFNNSTSGDSLYGPRVCDQAFINWAWEAHDFDKGDWDDGFGFDAPCDINLPLARTFNAIWALNYSAADYWNDGYDFSDRVPPGSVVTAIARKSDQIDLFVVGNDGGIYSTWWNPSDGWEGNHNWFRIGQPQHNVPPGSVVTAIARNPDQIDLFVVGHNGGIYSTWWNPNDGWEGNHNWFRIGPDWANVPQRSVVSAIARRPDQIDLFVVGNDGGIYSTWWNPNDGWEANHNWFRIGQQHSILNWACRYVWTQIDELDAACGDGTAAAKTFQGIDDYTELYLGYFYGEDVPSRASTLLHEARHMGGKAHDANFPPGSVFGSGNQADSSWSYQGAWMFDALYLWWFSVAGTRTTQAMRDLAKARGNLIINNAFNTHPGFTIP